MFWPMLLLTRRVTVVDTARTFFILFVVASTRSTFPSIALHFLAHSATLETFALVFVLAKIIRVCPRITARVMNK